MSNLPQFDRSRAAGGVHGYVEQVFKQGSANYLLDLVFYDDGHFRAVFDPNYFTLAEGRTEPSRSQWNTLKKHMKRIDKSAFIFKEHGFLEDGRAYVDFGFFQD